MKRFISFLLVVTLLCAALPVTALADGLEDLVRESALSAAEKEKARLLAGMDVGAASWTEGQVITPDSTPRQVEEYLEWLLEKDVDGLLRSMQDTDALLNKRSDARSAYERDLSKTEVEKLRNELTYYQRILDDNRTSLSAALGMLDQGSLMNQYRQNRRARQAMEELENTVAYVAGVCASNGSYETEIARFRAQFLAYSDAANFPESSRLSDEETIAAAKTNAEGALLSSQQGKEFSLRVVSTSQFAIVVKGENDEPLPGVAITVTDTRSDNKGMATTDTDGVALFEIKNFSPDKNNTVCVNVEITFRYGELRTVYGEREARRMYVKGGYSIPFKMSKVDRDRPYLKMVSFNGMDVLGQKQVVYFSTKNDAKFTFDVCVNTMPYQPKTKGTVFLIYEAYNGKETEQRDMVQEFTSGESISFPGKWLQTLVPGSDVIIRVTLDGEKTYDYKTQLVVEQAVVNEPVTDQSKAFDVLSSFFSFNLPDDLPFIGGMNLSLNLPQPSKVQLMIDPSGDIFLRIGESYTIDEWKKSTPYEREDRQAREALIAARQEKAAKENIYEHWPVEETTFLGSFKALFSPILNLMGKFAPKTGEVDHDVFELTGAAGFQGSLVANFCKTFWVSGIPIMVALDMRFALGAAFIAAFQWDWDGHDLSNLQLDKGSGLDLNILMELGVSGGVGIQNVASAVIRFFARMALFARVGDAEQAKLTMSIGFQIILQFLILKVSQNIWSGSLTFSTNGDDGAAAAAANDSQVVYTMPENPSAEEWEALCGGINSDELFGTPVNSSNAVITPELLYQDAASSSQAIQYVTLTNGTQAYTYGFWITPSERGSYWSGCGKLAWFNMDVKGQKGDLIPTDSEVWQPQSEMIDKRTSRIASTDYAFSVMSDRDMVAVAVTGGSLSDQGPMAGSCSCDVAVLQMQSDGSLKMLDYKTMKGDDMGSRPLGNPMVYIQRFEDQFPVSNHYSVSVGCTTVPGRETNGADKVYFMTFQGWKDRAYPWMYHTLYNLSSETLPQEMSQFTMAVPDSMRLKDENASNAIDPYVRKDEKSVACFFSLTKPETQEGETEATSGNLYLNMNGTHRLIDTDVTFMVPLVSSNSMAITDHTEHLFYLKQVTDKDGTQRYELMSAQLYSHAKGMTITVEKHGIYVPGGGFHVTVIPDAAGGYGTPCLYWIEYAENATGDAKSGQPTDTDKVTKLRGVTFDRSAQVMYGPFTLAEMDAGVSVEARDKNPINGVYLSHVLRTTPESNVGMLRLYYSQENTERSQSYLNYQHIFGADVRLKADAEFTGIISEEPCVNPDSNAALLFSVENTGNLPIAGFTVALYTKNASGQWVYNSDVEVDCANIVNSSYHYSKQYYENDSEWSPNGTNAPVMFEFDQHVVTRVSNLFDQYNNDLWVQETTTMEIPLDGSAANAQPITATSVKSTDLLMPDAVHTYRAVYKIPADWDGAVPMVAKISKVRVLQQMGGTVVNETGLRAAGGEAVEIIVDDEGNVQYPPTNSGGMFISICGPTAQYETEKGDNIGAGRSDLDLRCTPYVDDTGEEFVRVNITARTVHAGQASPTLTVTLDGSTTPVFTHRFKEAIGEDFGYTLDIPAESLLKGAASATAVFTLVNHESPNDNPNQVDTSEYSTIDNQRTVKLGSGLRIVQNPESIQAFENDSITFTVAAKGGSKPYTYQWQRRLGNTSWTNLPDSNAPVLTLNQVALMDNQAEYRCVVTDAYRITATSQSATLTVTPGIPKTGDDASLALWTVMGLLSLMGAAYLMAKRRRV